MIVELAVALILTRMGLGAKRYLFNNERVNGVLRTSAAKQIADLAEDERGKVIGRVRAIDEILHAPLTGRRCIYYEVIVEENGLEVWKPIISEARAVLFMLEDATGRAIVDVHGADVALDFDSRSKSGTFDDPSEAERAFLERHGEEGGRWIFNRTLRYYEAVIQEGDTIAVLGAGTREPDPEAPPEAAYRGEPPTRLRLTSSAKHPLVISDDRSAAR